MSPKNTLRDLSYPVRSIRKGPDHDVSVDPEDLVKRIAKNQEALKRLQNENASLKEKLARKKTESTAIKKELRGEAAKRLRAEESIKTTNFQFLSTLESITDGFLFCDRKWRCKYINEAACRILHRKREALIGQVGWDVCAQTRTLKFNHEFNRALKENVPVHLEEFYPAPLNIWVECHVYPTPDGLAIYFQDITERKKAEAELVASREGMRIMAEDLAKSNEELLESRKKFQDLVQEVDDIIFETAPDGRIIFVSSRVSDFLGYKPEEVMGRMPSEFFEKSKAAEMRDSLLQIIGKEGKLESIEVPLTHKDGHRVIAETNAVPFFKKGILMGYRGVTRDISTRKNAEESLRLAINAANDAIYDWDFVHGKINWNEAYSAQFGDPPKTGKKIEKWWINNIHPDDRKKALQCKSEAKKKDHVRWTSEYRFKRRDGNYACIRDRFHIARNSDGTATRFVGTMLDVTDYKQRESELELINVELDNHAKILDQILSALPDYIYLFDINGTYAYINDRAAEIWGVKKEDVIGRSWRDIGLNANITEVLHPQIHKVIDENTAVKGELEYRGRYFDYLLTPISSGPRPEGIMFTARDITDHKQMQAELEKRAESMNETNRELESFSYSISHDLRAPLAAIKGISEMIVSEYRDKVLDEKAGRFLELVQSNVNMMDELIKGVLMLSRVSRQELKKSKLKIREIAADVYEQIKLVSPKGPLDFRIKDMPDSTGDPVLIRQVFSNLISNAIKFSKKRREPRIEVGGYREPDRCVYYVSDNGAGFKMKNYDKLFAIFQRLHNESEFEGTGIGLAIVQKIVQRHGGHIWAESKVNKGAKFYFSLPTAI